MIRTAKKEATLSVRERFLRLLYLFLQKIGLVPRNTFIYAKLARRFNIAILYQKIVGLPGCIVECGVASGQSLVVLKILSIAENKGRRIYGFDTFEGLPEPRPHERGKKGWFKYSKASVVQFFKDANTPMDNVELVEGDISETLKGFEFPEPVAFLHIDVDLYDGYKAALDGLWEKIVPGGVVLFDDYEEWAGAAKAVREFLDAHPGVALQKAEFARKAYIIKP